MSTDGTGRQSPLSAFFATAAGDAADGAAVVISERPFLGHLNLRGDPGGGGFTSAAAGVLGFALPTEPNTTVGEGGLLALWLGPDEWLVVTPPDAQTLVCGLPRNSAPGRPRLGHRRHRRSDRDNAERPKGPRRPGERLPARPPPLGLRPRRLRPDPARQGQRDASDASTTRRRFELIVRRSFAEYAALWLQDAALEYGCAVVLRPQ